MPPMVAEQIQRSAPGGKPPMGAVGALFKAAKSGELVPNAEQLAAQFNWWKTALRFLIDHSKAGATAPLAAAVEPVAAAPAAAHASTVVAPHAAVTPKTGARGWPESAPERSLCSPKPSLPSPPGRSEGSGSHGVPWQP